MVPPDGTPAAQTAMRQVYETRADGAWRGLGTIAFSGLQLRPAWRAFDAEHRFTLTPHSVPDPASARCGAVLTGRIRPTECPAFGQDCDRQSAV